MVIDFNDKFLFLPPTATSNYPSIPFSLSVCPAVTHRTEGPAGATMTLVLNLSHVADSPPVYSFWKSSTLQSLEECSCIIDLCLIEGSQAALQHLLVLLVVLLEKKMVRGF